MGVFLEREPGFFIEIVFKIDFAPVRFVAALNVFALSMAQPFPQLAS
jgi:hypothetical protein